MNKLIKASTTYLESPNLLTILAIILAFIVGIFCVIFASFFGERYGTLLALPGLLLLIISFYFSKNTLFYLIILFRSVMDPILDTTKLGSFGLGAVINALVILIAIMAVLDKPNPVRKVLNASWLPFFLISIVTLVIAPSFVTALKTYLAILSYASVFSLAIVLINNDEEFGHWMKVIFLSSVIPVCYGFIDAVTGGFQSSDVDFRISSTFSHPNIFAFYLVLMISLGFYFIKSKFSFISSWVHKVLPLYILMMCALLLMTKTRSAWVACIAFFIMYAIVYERKFLVLIVLSLMAAMLVPEIRDRVLDLNQGNEVINYSKLNSYAWRKLIWGDGLYWMTPGHYFFGYGLESFKFYSVDFFTMSGGQNMGAHSVYVQLFFEVGAFGLLAFVWAHLKVANLLIPFYKQNKLMIFSALMFLIEYALYSYSDNMLSYLSFNWYFWFVLGAIYAVNYSKQQKVQANQLP